MPIDPSPYKTHRYRQGNNASALFPFWEPLGHDRQSTPSILEWLMLFARYFWCYAYKWSAWIYERNPLRKTALEALNECLIIEAKFLFLQKHRDQEWQKNQIHMLRQQQLDHLEKILNNYKKSQGIEVLPSHHQFPEIVLVMANTLIENPEGHHATLTERAHRLVSAYELMRKQLKRSMSFGWVAFLQLHREDFLIASLHSFEEAWNSFKAFRSQQITHIKSGGDSRVESMSQIFKQSLEDNQEELKIVNKTLREHKGSGIPGKENSP